MALKDIPQNFNLDSEAGVRIALSKFFIDLVGSDEIEAKTEFTIQLGDTKLVVIGDESIRHKRVTNRIDYLLTRRGKPLAVVETKSPEISLDDATPDQVIAYARLVPGIAPFAILTNGRNTRVYDTLASGRTLLETPIDSVWYKNGEQISSIGRDTGLEASRTFIEKIHERQIQTSNEGHLKTPRLIENTRRFLNQHRQESLNQARTTFVVAIIALVFGIVLVFIGIILILTISLPIGSVTAISSIISDVICGLAFRFNKEVNDRLESITNELSNLERFSEAMLFIGYISDKEKQDQAIIDLVKQLYASSSNKTLQKEKD